MPGHFSDKSLTHESWMGGWSLLKLRAFAEPGVEPAYAPDRSIDIQHIGLTLDIDPVARKLAGVADIRFKRFPGGGPIRLNCVELIVDGVTALPVTGVAPDAGDRPPVALPFRHEEGVLIIDAPARCRRICVRYHGSPRRGLWFVGPTPNAPARPPEAWTQCQDEDGRYIFPCIDQPQVKHAWSVAVTVPPGYEVVGNGRADGREETPAGVCWRWTQAEPMPAYLFTLAILQAEVVEDACELPGDRGAARALPVRYIVPAGTDAAVTRRVFGKTPAMIRFLSDLWVSYPWPRYDQVVVHEFIFGGMENVAATTLFDLVLTDARAAIDYDADDLIVHELAHQWFGDLLTCQDWSQGWLNEGWATWTETLWFAHDRGQDAADAHLWEHLQNYLGEATGRYCRPIVSYRFRNPIDVFDRHLYEKGAMILHTLRTVLGADVFWAGVRRYLQQHRYGSVHTRDFQRAMEQASGRNLDGFFFAFVHGAGHPVLEVKLGYTDGMLSVQVRQTQEGPEISPVFAVPLAIRIDGQAHTLALSQREQTFLLPCPVRPALVSVDDGFSILADLRLSGPVSLLSASLQKDPGLIGRVRAARALGTDGSFEAINALAAAISAGTGDPHWLVRAEIAALLGQQGGDAAVSALIGALSDPHPKVRQAVAAALGQCRRADAADALAALGADPSLQVEGETARALAKLRHPSARARCEALLPQAAWMDLLQARGLEGLSWLRDASVLPTLIAWTQPERPARARAAAAAGIARLGEGIESIRRECRERLEQLAEDREFRVQLSAISALAALRDPAACAVLERIHRTAPEGRAARYAFEAMASLREGQNAPAARQEIEELRVEARKLRDGLWRVEQQIKK